jgi:hypothetical protein
LKLEKEQSSAKLSEGYRKKEQGSANLGVVFRRAPRSGRVVEEDERVTRRYKAL